MSHPPRTAGRSGLSSTSKMSFAVAGCAFAAAGIGLLINQWMSGWMAVGGMAGVGLFYLAVGLLNLGSTDSIFHGDDDLTETSAHRLSGVSNVDDIAIEQPHKTIGTTGEESLAKSRH